jgi:hypothetical protein
VTKSLFFVLLFTLELFSCSSKFNICQKKVSDAKVFLNSTLISIPVKNHNRLIYSTKVPNFTYKKYDPFLGLTLVKDSSNFAYPFVFYTKDKKELFAVNNNSSLKGKIISEQCGLDELGKFSKATKRVSLITDSCCALAGVMSVDGLIDTHYLKHFLDFKAKDVVYGDAGIRIDKKNSALHVSRVNPFFKNQKFLEDDIILAFDAKETNSLCKLRRFILFAKIGSIHRFKILRNSKVKYIKVKIQKRLGGGLLSDTFLESFGLYLDDSLCIKTVSAKSVDMQVDVGDCLIQVNFHDVSTAKDIQKQLQSGDIDNALLFERNNFQFFIHINGKSGKITKKNN